jgi:glycosyltransferase involved in cell wall biosynthesis
LIRPLLEDVLEGILDAFPHAYVVLLGKGGDEVARAFENRHPQFAGRIEGAGRMEAEAVSVHLAACDVLVQPYPDGISTRRTSVMAGLALGVPTVSNAGALSEGTWAQTGAVALAAHPGGAAYVLELKALLAHSGALATLGARGRAVYFERFSLERTVESLQACAREAGLPGAAPAPAASEL